MSLLGNDIDFEFADIEASLSRRDEIDFEFSEIEASLSRRNEKVDFIDMTKMKWSKKFTFCDVIFQPFFVFYFFVNLLSFFHLFVFLF